MVPFLLNFDSIELSVKMSLNLIQIVWQAFKFVLNLIYLFIR